MEYYSVIKNETMLFAGKLDGNIDYMICRLAGQQVLRLAFLRSPSSEIMYHRCHAQLLQGC